MIALLQLHISKSSTNVPTKKASLDLKKKTKKKVSARCFQSGTLEQTHRWRKRGRRPLWRFTCLTSCDFRPSLDRLYHHLRNLPAQCPSNAGNIFLKKWLLGDAETPPTAPRAPLIKPLLPAGREWKGEILRLAADVPDG